MGISIAMIGFGCFLGEFPHRAESKSITYQNHYMTPSKLKTAEIKLGVVVLEASHELDDISPLVVGSEQYSPTAEGGTKRKYHRYNDDLHRSLEGLQSRARCGACTKDKRGCFRPKGTEDYLYCLGKKLDPKIV